MWVWELNPSALVVWEVLLSLTFLLKKLLWLVLLIG